jgi:hypothetical protein
MENLMNLQYKNFKNECDLEISKQGSSQEVLKLTQEWVRSLNDEDLITYHNPGPEHDQARAGVAARP